MNENDIEYDEDIDINEMNNCDNLQDCVNINGEWINHDSKPIKQIMCFISNSILERVRDIQFSIEKKYNSSNEFGGYVKWHWEQGSIIVDDFVVPKQRVGGATIDFLEPSVEGYTGVFHKHPTGCKRFSSVDDTYINSNHDLSLLFESNNFIYGIVNIKLPDGIRYQTQLKIVNQQVEKRKLVNIDNISSNFEYKLENSTFEDITSGCFPLNFDD